MVEKELVNKSFEKMHEGIRASISSFIAGVQNAFQTIMCVNLTLPEREYVKADKKFNTKYTTIVSVPLSGSVTGEFFLCVNKEDWLPYLSSISGMAVEDEGMSELLYSTLQEIINTAAGEAIGTVKETFGAITMMSPRLIEGYLMYPATKIFNIDFVVEGEKLEVEARMSLDLMEQDLSVEHEKLKEDSKMDDTGLYNKKYFLEILAKMEERFKNDGFFSIIFADINRLKYVNDTYGHDAGDAYIQAACNIIRQSCRFSDYCFRVGGDELVIVLPKCGKEDIVQVVNRINSFMKTEVIRGKKEDGTNEQIEVHMSIGSASNSEGIPVDQVLKVADQRMEQNKRDWYESMDLTRRK